MRRQATERLLVAAVSTIVGAIVAIVAGVPEAALLVAPWMALLALGLSRAHRPDARVAVRAAPSRVMVGDEVAVTVDIVAGDGSLKATLRPGGDFGWSDDAEPARADVVTPGRRTTLEWSVPARQWGTHDLGRADLAITEPHGLLRWQGTFVDPAPVRVHPTASQLRRLLAPRLVRRITGSHASTAVDRGVEYADIRRFAPGDSLRDVNWRASARTDELWVSQRHADRATDVVLLLDTFVEPGRTTRRTLGLAIEAAVALAESHLARTDRVGLIDLGGIVRWVSPRAGSLQLQRLTDALLATVPYDNAAEKDLRMIPPRGLPPRSFVIALSPLVDDRFVAALHAIAAGGHDVGVIETPPDGAGAGSTPASAVARRLWEAERQITRDELAARGIALARWLPGDGLDVVLTELIRARSRSARRVGAR